MSNNTHNKRKILIADDDAAILDALKMMLEETDYEVVTTADGQVVRDIKEPLPSIILLDIWMSGMDGTKICEYLKKHEATKHIHIILFSANKDTEKLAKECGADDFISKPFQMNDLLNKIAAYSD